MWYDVAIYILKLLACLAVILVAFGIAAAIIAWLLPKPYLDDPLDDEK